MPLFMCIFYVFNLVYLIEKNHQDYHQDLFNIQFKCIYTFI